LRYLDAPDRPQPRYDRDAEDGMGVTLGRLRRCAVLDYRFVCLSHNTIRGAAGATLLNAELAFARGLLAASGRSA
jgi:aspartate-semialdehyde dehydrogenase